MSIMDVIKDLTNNIYTQNKDSAFASTLNANLDFFSVAGASRQNPDNIRPLFIKAFYEDKKLAIQNLFYLRDIRKGLGERNSFRIALSFLVEEQEEIAKKLLPYIVEYGRFDDILVYLDNHKLHQVLADFIKNQLDEDIRNYMQDNNISLCSKWLPSINATSTKTKENAKKLAKLMNMSEKEYRKTLSKLRKGKIVERNLTEKDYTFEYEKLPSKALNKYVSAFNRNDKQRYDEYKSKLSKGEIQAKVDILYPYEILNMLYKDVELAEIQWKSLKRSEDSKNTIVVRDGSGSMTCYKNVYETATSLAILFSEQLTGVFKNKFITFSANPKLVELPEGGSLREKNNICASYDEVANTDIKKVYQLILNASKKIKNPKDYINRIVIISDMQFDVGTQNVPTYVEMKNDFEKTGIPLPEIIYWNVNAFRVTFAYKKDDPNIRFISGLSGNIIETIINNQAVDPVDFMIKSLSRYDFVENIL